VGQTATCGTIDRNAHALIANGDRPGALTVLMDGYGNHLFAFCYGVVRCQFTANDVLQTTFVQAYQELGTISCHSFRPWLFKIAHNRCLDALKADKRRNTRISLPGELPEEPDQGLSSEERLIADSLAAHLEECLGKLEPAARMAILLKYQEDFTYKEMARICHEEPATLHARVKRALPALRRCLLSKGVRP
jgi:RNA polymerase sigma-70 factor (ECF subfamily)